MSAPPAAPSGESFEYEPRPNMLEQRELRREYRALLASAQSTRRHLPESSIGDVGDMVRLGDELYTKDSLLDSRFLLSMSDMGAEMTRTRRVGADAFDMDDYLHRVAQYMGGHVVSGSDQRRAAQDVAAEAVATGDRELWDWEKLGRVAAQHTRRAPIPDFLLGPLHVVPKHRKVTRTSRLETDAEHIAPQQLEADDLAQSENETSRMVLEIATLLEAASGDEGVPLFAFALNPASFSNSVENLFYISFLIRDGKAAIVDDAEGDPLLMSTYEPTAEDRDAGLTRRQIVLELDMHTWKELCMLYNVTVPMIPTRTETQQAVGNTRWYG